MMENNKKNCSEPGAGVFGEPVEHVRPEGGTAQKSVGKSFFSIAFLCIFPTIFILFILLPLFYTARVCCCYPYYLNIKESRDYKEQIMWL